MSGDSIKPHEAQAVVDSMFSEKISVKQGENLGFSMTGKKTITYSPDNPRIEAVTTGGWNTQDHDKVKAIILRQAEAARLGIQEVRRDTTAECLGKSSGGTVGYSGPGNASSYSIDKLSMLIAHHITLSIAEANIIQQQPSTVSDFKLASPEEDAHEHSSGQTSFMYSDFITLARRGAMLEEAISKLSTSDIHLLANIRQFIHQYRCRPETCTQQEVTELSATIAGWLIDEYLAFEPENQSELPSIRIDVQTVDSLLAADSPPPSDWYRETRSTPRKVAQIQS